MEYQTGAVSPIGSIQRGWEIIKNDYWIFFLMTLVMIVILVAASLILGFINNMITTVIAGALGFATQGGGDAAQLSAALAPQLISLFINIFTGIIVSTLSGVLYCGIYSALARKVGTGTVDFADLFNGFQQIQPCVIVAVVLSLIGFAIGVVSLLGMGALGFSALSLGALAQGGQVNPAALGGLFAAVAAFLVFSLVANLILSALTCFIYPLIGERHATAGAAILTSVKSGLGNLFGLIFMFILLGLIGLGGFLLCGFGLLFVAPIFPAAIFAAYQSVFGSRSNEDYRYTPPAPPTFGQQPGY